MELLKEPEVNLRSVVIFGKGRLGCLDVTIEPLVEDVELLGCFQDSKNINTIQFT